MWGSDPKLGVTLGGWERYNLSFGLGFLLTFNTNYRLYDTLFNQQFHKRDQPTISEHFCDT